MTNLGFHSLGVKFDHFYCAFSISLQIFMRNISLLTAKYNRTIFIAINIECPYLFDV